jgi:inorganic pyrophosphatase
MENLFHLPLECGVEGAVNAVVEVPLGGSNKYVYDPRLEVFRLDRRLHSPLHYPGNHGFFPRTLGAKERPVTVLVFTGAPCFPGCVIEVRPIGMLELVDEGVPEAKVIAVGRNSPRFAKVRELADVRQHVLREIEAFFTAYKTLEDKRVDAIAWHDSEHAWAAIRHGHQRFRDDRDSRR